MTEPLELPEQIANRRASRARIAALGRALYPNRWDPTHLVSDVVAKWSSRDAAALDATPEADRYVRVPGRILAIRKMGKAIFLDLSDGVGRVQAYMKKDALRTGDWELLEQLDLGDHVGIAGSVFRTRTGELSVRAGSLDFLSKSLRPLPDKWHGLTDVERKYRQRYVDLVVSPETRRTFEIRAKIVAFIRRFFDARGFVEVETPMMQTLAGGAAARPFVTHHNALDLDLFLRIAPELYLKRLVVGGFPKVYEINRNFRNEGISTHHNPEFTMLEFYTAYADARDQMALTEELLTSAAREILGTTELKWGDETLSLKAPFKRISMVDAILENVEAAERDWEEREDFFEWSRAGCGAGRATGRPGGFCEGFRTSGRTHRRHPREPLGSSPSKKNSRTFWCRVCRALRRFQGEITRRDLLGRRGATASAADVRRRLSRGDLAALEDEAGRPEHRRPLRAVHRTDGGRERVLRAERPRRAGGEVPRAGERARQG